MAAQAPNEGPREMNVRRSITAIIVSAMAATMFAAGAQTASANSSFESQFVSKINAERAKRGLGTLSSQSDLVSVARSWSKYQADGKCPGNESICHNPNLDKQVSGWRWLGENVGVGPDVDSLHRAFMNSEGHRHNILLSHFNQVGIGVYVDDGIIYVTEVFAQRGSTSSSSGSSSSSSSSAGSVGAASGSVIPVAAPPKPKPKPEPRTLHQLEVVLNLD